MALWREQSIYKVSANVQLIEHRQQRWKLTLVFVQFSVQANDLFVFTNIAPQFSRAEPRKSCVHSYMVNFQFYKTHAIM